MKSAPASLDERQRQLVRTATALLDEARSRSQGPGLHRSLRRLRASPLALLEVLAGAAAFTAALWWLKPALMAAWEGLILGWAQQLELPLAIAQTALGREWVLLADAASLVPGPFTGLFTAAGVIAAFAGTFWMPDRMVPLKYLVRTLCVVQASALLYFMFVPSQFPYTVGGHVSAMLASGYYLMLAMPLLLALGYGVLKLPRHQKLLYPAGLLAWFALMLPHKALLHVWILAEFSVLFMPMLYLCFGLVFDLMVFVALYSWLVSRVPERALG
jgi:hypothetical protein